MADRVECDFCIFMDRDPGRGTNGRGRCRRHAPWLVWAYKNLPDKLVETMFPVVYGGTDWCGDGVAAPEIKT